MPRSISRSVRGSFAALAAALLLFAGAQSLQPSPEPVGLSSCGTNDNPCVLPPLIVVAPPAAPANTPEVAAAAEGGTGATAGDPAQS